MIHISHNGQAHSFNPADIARVNLSNDHLRVTIKLKDSRTKVLEGAKADIVRIYQDICEEWM